MAWEKSKLLGLAATFMFAAAVFLIAGDNILADATACVKSTCFNMRKAGYAVHVISDCVTSYDLRKMDEMLAYYAGKGCEVATLQELPERA